MTDDTDLAVLIEKDIMSFGSVSRFPGIGFTGNIQNILTRDRINPGIRINEDDDGIIVNCEIIVYFGINIPQLCYDIQSRVKRDIEEQTGLTVKAVNIRVEGIDRRPEADRSQLYPAE